MAIANVTEHCMKMQIPEISKLNEIWSPEILIHGIPWKVKVCKNDVDQQPWIAVYLYCANKDKSPNWSLSGSASFKLLSFNNRDEPVEYHSSTFLFDRSGTGYGKPKFIQWDDLFDKAKNYVKNDTIKLEVNVKAENPNDPNRSRLKFKCIDKCCDNAKQANYRLKVTNITNLMAVRSTKFKLCGLMWQVHISKKDESHLNVLLILKEASDEVSYKMTMSIKLVSSKEDVHSIEKCETTKYQKPDLNVVEVVSWDELMKPDNGFVSNDSITLEIKLISDEPKNYEASGANADPENEVNPKQMECAICLECIDNQDIACTPCGHLFCFECIKKVVTERGTCPTCTKPVQLATLRHLYLPFVN